MSSPPGMALSLHPWGVTGDKGLGTLRVFGAAAGGRKGGFLHSPVPPGPGCTPSLAGGPGGRWHRPGAWGMSRVKGLKGFGCRWGFKSEGIAVPAQLLWSLRSGFGCSPENPGVVALLCGAREKCGATPSPPKTRGSPFCQGSCCRLTTAFRGGFWQCVVIPPPYPPGKLLAEHARQSGEQRGRPQGRASAHKGSEETPSVQGTWAGTVPPLKHPKTPGDGWGEKAASTASQRLPGVPVDQSDPDAKRRKGRLMEAEEYFFFLFSLSLFFLKKNLSLSANTIWLPQLCQRFQSPGSFALPNYCH